MRNYNNSNLLTSKEKKMLGYRTLGPVASQHQYQEIRLPSSVIRNKYPHLHGLILNSQHNMPSKYNTLPAINSKVHRARGGKQPQKRASPQEISLLKSSPLKDKLASISEQSYLVPPMTSSTTCSTTSHFINTSKSQRLGSTEEASPSRRRSVNGNRSKRQTNRQLIHQMYNQQQEPITPPKRVRMVPDDFEVGHRHSVVR